MSSDIDREIHILCGAVSPPSRPRFESEAELLGRAVRWIDPHAVDPVPAGLALAGEPLPLPEVALARGGGYTTDRALETLHAYEALGVTMVDSAEAIERCRDKVAAAGLLASAGLPLPRTIALGGVGGASTERGVIEAVGDLPLVVKPTRGMKGEGVRLVQASDDLEDAVASGRPLLAQEYVPHEYDLRVIVVGGEAIGGIRRVPETDFRSNLHLGGRAEGVTVTEEVARLATTAAAALGAEVAGVDLLPTADGFVVLEVNSSPGFDGFESATGANVARAIVVHALSLA